MVGWVLLGGLGLLLGCGGDKISLTQIAPGSQCPNGGVAVSTSSGGKEIVCNAGVATATLPPGDPHCPNGGTRLDVTSASGTVSSQYLCNGSSGAQSASLDPPDGPPGSFTIVTRGGAGSAGAGAPGGDVTLRMAAGTLGGHVKMFRTGLTDASFIAPTVGTSELGSTPLTVSSGTTVVAAKATVSCSGIPAGGAFTAADTPGPVFRCNGSAAAEQVSGISVGAGATLSFAARSCPGTSTACVVARVRAAFRNAGTVGIDASAVPGLLPSLTLVPGSYVGDSGSSIRVPGGLLTIDTVTQQGAIWNQGALDVSGADTSGPAGGVAGAITLDSYYGLVNSGTLTLRGGAATGSGGAGGSGGSLELHSSDGAILQSGAVDASGGNGIAVGGDGGEIRLEVLRGTGSLRSGGPLLAAGGAASSGCTSGCRGGSGGIVVVSSLSGDLLHSASIDVHGGSGAAGPGGTGGNVSLSALTGLGPGGGSPQATGNLYASGDLTTRGGDGSTGGVGGAVELVLDPRTAPRGQELILLGYATLDTRGGDGSTSGGGGGTLSLVNAASFVEGGLGAGGGVVNEADVVTGGGAGADLGGSAGAVLLQSQIDNAGTVGYVEPAVNRGALTLNGGSGGTVGGEGGAARLEGRTAVDSQGVIVSQGGPSATGGGGPGGRCSLLSVAGGVTSNGRIEASGGAVSPGGNGSAGGTGGVVLLQGLSVDSKAVLAAAGGDGGLGVGGGGGRIALAATSGKVSNTATGFDVRGGTGTAGPGTAGLVVLDGQVVPAP
jgi:hypothetical protein